MADYNNYNLNQNQQNGYPAQGNGQQPYVDNNYGQQQYAGNNYGQQQYAGNNYGQQPYGYEAPMAVPEKKGMSIASMVLGFCSFIAWLIPLFGYPVTIVGIIMGAVGMKKGGKGMAITGIICCSIGLLLSLLNSIAGVALMMNAANYY